MATRGFKRPDSSEDPQVGDAVQTQFKYSFHESVCFSGRRERRESRRECLGYELRPCACSDSLCRVHQCHAPTTVLLRNVCVRFPALNLLRNSCMWRKLVPACSSGLMGHFYCFSFKYTYFKMYKHMSNLWPYF